MKKKISRIFTILFSACALLFTTGCDFSCDLRDGAFGEQKKSYAWISNYTEQEHVARITAFTEEFFKKEIEYGELVSFEVEILYDFYGAPRFYMVDFEYGFDVEKYVKYTTTLVYSTRQGHFIGEILNDEYYNANNAGGYRDGPNPYDYLGYGEAKKYFLARRYVVDTPDGLLQIYYDYGEDLIFVNNEESHFEKIIITAEERKKHMYNFTHMMQLYRSYEECLRYSPLIYWNPYI